MTGLLDTQILIWMDQEPDRLSDDARRFILDPANRLLLSLASVWELVIKVPTGKLDIPDPVPVLLDRQLGNGLSLLDIRLAHVFAVERLPRFHRDPFDHLILAQAITEGIPVVSADEKFPQYPVTVIW